MTGGASSGRKGSKYERRLVNSLGGAGWFAMRAPSSGSATDEDLPDVFAMRHVEVPRNYVRIAGVRPYLAEVLTIEHKSGKATTLYVDEREVEALQRLAITSGAVPLLGARFTTQATTTDHYLVRPRDARRTDGGNYGLPQSDIAERASVVVRESGEVEVGL